MDRQEAWQPRGKKALTPKRRRWLDIVETRNKPVRPASQKAGGEHHPIFQNGFAHGQDRRQSLISAPIFPRRLDWRNCTRTKRRECGRLTQFGDRETRKRLVWPSESGSSTLNAGALVKIGFIDNDRLHDPSWPVADKVLKQVVFLLMRQAYDDGELRAALPLISRLLRDQDLMPMHSSKILGQARDRSHLNLKRYAASKQLFCASARCCARYHLGQGSMVMPRSGRNGMVGNHHKSTSYQQSERSFAYATSLPLTSAVLQLAQRVCQPDHHRSYARYEHHTLGVGCASSKGWRRQRRQEIVYSSRVIRPLRAAGKLSWQESSVRSIDIFALPLSTISLASRTKQASVAVMLLSISDLNLPSGR